MAECDIKMKEHDAVIDKVQAILTRAEELNKPDVSLESAYEILANLKVRLCLVLSVKLTRALGVRKLNISCL